MCFICIIPLISWSRVGPIVSIKKENCTSEIFTGNGGDIARDTAASNSSFFFTLIV